jgi:hypothetical protein
MKDITLNASPNADVFREFIIIGSRKARIEVGEAKAYISV